MAHDDRLLMCAENLREGMKLGPIHYLVSADQARRFLNALHCDNALLAAESASGAQVAPPTMRLNDYALLIAEHFRGGSGGVHAKHRCEFFEPIRVGQAVKVTGTIARTWWNRGKFYFELEYEARDADSDRLLTRQAITSILLQKGQMQ